MTWEPEISMTPVFQHGTLGAFRLAEPAAEISRVRDGEDALNESWHDTRPGVWVEGMVHPEYPGMIIDQVRERIVMPNHSYVYAITALGSVDAKRATKVLSRGRAVTLDIGWDELTVEYLTWQARWKACTGVASSEVLTCDGHGFVNGQKVVFDQLTGGAGLTPMAVGSRGVAYFVITATATTFQVSLTLGGSAVNLTSNLTAGKVCAAEFVKGHAHADYPNMYAVDVAMHDANTDWQRVRVTYRGMMETKPYKRIITCGSQTMSSSDPIAVSFPGGWGTPQNSSVNLPKVTCTDVYLTTDALATDMVPSSQADGATPPDPPAIRGLVITADDEDLIFHWPNGWSLVAEETQDSIPAASVVLKRRVTEYIWPVTFGGSGEEQPEE